MQFLGHNFRMTDFQCALGSRQLEKLPDFAARRRKFMKRYDERFAPFRQVMQPVSRLPGTNPCLHLYALLIDFEAVGRTRAEMMIQLRARKIGTQVHYIPVHYQPYYRERYGKLSLPGTAQYYDRALSIPFYPAMKDEDIEFVADNVCDVLGLRKA
jgi:dTDP-4-amino-4,6-dideoxygalactose transaminase